MSPEKFSWLIIAQIVLAIPLLFISSLSYSKVAYWSRHEAYDRLGWLTNTLGNSLLLNAVGLMTATFYKNLAFFYFGLLVLLMFSYHSIGVYYKRHNFKERLIKFLLFLVVLFAGGIAPLL